MQKETVVVEAEIIDDQPDKVKSDLRKFNKAEEQVNKALAALDTIEGIEDQPAVDEAMEIMKKASSVEKLIEEKRKQLVKPYNDEVSRINKYAKELTAKIPPAIQKVKDHVLAFHRAEEKRQKELRADARKLQLISLGYFLVDERYELKISPEPLVIHPNFIFEMTDQVWSQYIAKVNGKLEAARQQEIQQLEKQSESAGFFGDMDEKQTIESKIDEVKSQPAVPVTTTIPSFNSTKNNGLTKRWTHELVDLGQVPREYLVIDEKKVREAIAAGERNIPGLRIFQSESITLR